MAFYLGPGGAGDATGDASSASVLATQKAAEAAASAASALASASTATTASTTANTASSSASTSATSALNSATLAATSATTATTKAAEAVVSAASAATSASTATTKAAEAVTSASNAATSATAAATSATSASNSATSATASATTATNAASSASASASSASADAATATTKASEALASATSAATSATNAASSASSAASSASSASISASTATTQATNASASATAAATSATVAVSASGAVLWVSGTTYAVGFVVYSPITFRTYRRKVAGAGTTDPSIDATNWGALLLDAETQLPTMRPSLLLDFSNTSRLDPRVTFTRASTATRVNPNGLIETVASGLSRFDYDPVTDACKGLLIEEQRTNLLTYSEQFDNAAWVKTGLMVASNAAVSPDGGLSATKLIANTTATLISSSVNQTVTKATTTNLYTLSAFVKTGEYNSARLLASGANTSTARCIANFNLATGAVGTITQGTAGFSDCTANIVSVGNGYFRVSMTFTTDAATSVRGWLYGTDSVITTGDGVSGIYIWGAQLEAGAFATSYIPTVASQVTRAADVAVMTGTNFSSWYNQTEGTIYAEWVLGGDITSTSVYQADDGTNLNCLRLRYGASGTGNDTAVLLAGVSQTALSGGAQQTLYATYKNAMTYKLNDFARSSDGGVVSTDNSGSLPTVTRLALGGNSGTGEQLNGHIKRITYYPKRLTNAELQALTS